MRLVSRLPRSAFPTPAGLSRSVDHWGVARRGLVGPRCGSRPARPGPRRASTGRRLLNREQSSFGSMKRTFCACEWKCVYPSRSFPVACLCRVDVNESLDGDEPGSSPPSSPWLVDRFTLPLPAPTPSVLSAAARRPSATLCSSFIRPFLHPLIRPSNRPLNHPRFRLLGRPSFRPSSHPLIRPPIRPPKNWP